MGMGARALILVMAMLCVALCWSTASASGGMGNGPTEKPSARGGGGIGDRPSVEPSPSEAPAEPEVQPHEPQAQGPPSAEPSPADPESAPSEAPRPQQPEAQTSPPRDEPIARDPDPNMDPGMPTVASGPRYPTGGGGSVPTWLPEVLMRLPWIVAGSQARQWMPRPSWNQGWRPTRAPRARRR